MTRYAAGTDVTPERSRSEIERMIVRYGATHTAFVTRPGGASVAFEVRERRIRFDLPMPDRDAERFKYAATSKWSRRERTPEKQTLVWMGEVRQRWRALALVIKAKLEAVESGITTFEDEFMAHIVMPDGMTAAEHVRPWIERSYQLGRVAQIEGPKPNAQS